MNLLMKLLNFSGLTRHCEHYNRFGLNNSQNRSLRNRILAEMFNRNIT